MCPYCPTYRQKQLHFLLKLVTHRNFDYFVDNNNNAAFIGATTGFAQFILAYTFNLPHSLDIKLFKSGTRLIEGINV